MSEARLSVAALPGTDELLVAAEIRKRHLPRRQHLEEAARAAAMLHIGPARLVDGRQVEAVGRRKELGLVRTKPAAGLCFRLHARVLRTRAVGLLQGPHGGGEGDLGETTAHVGFPFQASRR
jgi:hypothetical protein